MSETLEAIKAVTPYVLLLVKELVDVFLRPKLADIKKRNDVEKDVNEYLFEEKFAEYMARCYEKYSYLSTIAFRNEQKSIFDLYIPLKVCVENNFRTEKVFTIHDYDDDFIPHYQRVLITDTAGMGKSTVLQWLFLSCIRRKKGIPIFIELRKLSKDNSMIDQLYKSISTIGEIPNESFILKLINEGDFVFFLDGYDEIPLSERETVTQDIQDFITKSYKNYYIITSRPEKALASFGYFQQFRMLPLEPKEAYALLNKYDNCGELSEKLIKKLETEKSMKNLREFLTNPMMVSLLFKAYCYKPLIPDKKHTFYRQVYDALFESHDLSKEGTLIREKYSKLDIEDFHKVLRYVAWISYKKGKIEYDKDELVDLVNEAKELCVEFNFKADSFIKDLITTVCLFRQEGLLYKWQHKSIQEYFVSRYIYEDSKGKQSDILKKIIASKRSAYYINVLDMFYDIDYKTFRNVVIYSLVSKFIEYCERTYQDIQLKDISEKDIIERKELTFSSTYAFCVNLNESHELYLNKNIDSIRKAFNMETPLRSISTTNAPDIIIISLDNEYYPLLEMLNIKKSDLVKKPNRSKEEITFEMRDSNPDFIMISDGNDCILNSTANFIKTNNIIKSSFYSLQLNYNICLKIKKDILRDIERENTDLSL